MMVAVFFQPEQAAAGHLQPWLVEAALVEFWRRKGKLSYAVFLLYFQFIGVTVHLLGSVHFPRWML